MTTSLYQSYLQAKQQHPEKYARDLAQLLNISEAELTHSRVGHDAVRLKSDIKALLAALENVGETKSITRNQHAVHEQIGKYTNQHLGDHAGLILNPYALDLRLFLEHWLFVFALKEESKRGTRHSIQFFDEYGDALHKVYTTENTDMDAWQKVIDTFAQQDNPALKLDAVQESSARQAVIDNQTIDSEWRAMTDVHQFFKLLNKHGITRQQAFNAVKDDLAQRVDNQSLRQILQMAKNEANDIMVFVGNRGCVQIFTGKIDRVAPIDGWINIFNKAFVLHLIENDIVESWVTRKPTKDGFVTSLELFAADGTQIAQLYGQRTEGQPEQQIWRTQIDTLLQQTVSA
ncbi:hemin-degrading factor [Budviciaceae bacterium BWR-B9]|uniref:Hemin-degrading factor n=1 Tax=Limnobaculum allomyrinae TaxID=2791986 RepID=A0ABS1IQJ5_9GAMM|nr:MULTISPECIES: ChuX/HutX family heme-like substrate-binding protein [Limnobaculum]MBK5143832.1 hemin-degrading factor [Limnobaculum allomyrinae]MBV7693571.1 hemin-degrading factor [Limnobaculum sp. M2-1]